jgi:predicted acylesterase/phospholipase RssA
VIVPVTRAPRWLGTRTAFAVAGLADALADLVLASSCTPPFTPLLHHAGRPVLDGSIADNVPVDAAGDGPVLVLLTRPFRRLTTRWRWSRPAARSSPLISVTCARQAPKAGSPRWERWRNAA